MTQRVVRIVLALGLLIGWSALAEAQTGKEKGKRKKGLERGTGALILDV